MDSPSDTGPNPSQGVSWLKYRQLCVQDWTTLYGLPTPRDEEAANAPTVKLAQVREAISALRRSFYRNLQFTAEQQQAIDFAVRYRTWFDAFAFQMLGEGNSYKEVQARISPPHHSADDSSST
jgi:hypothetical protein